MNLLAIDTVTENCSVAISLGSNRQIDTLETVTAAGHAGRLHGMISQLLARHDIGYADLHGIVVDTGPGSFTGVRIGLGVAQGLAYARGIGVLGASSLQALAQHCSSEVCIPAIDARMQQVYWAAYRCSGTTPEKLCGPFVSNPSDVAVLLARHVDSQQRSDSGTITGMGSGWDNYPESMPESVWEVGIDTVKSKFPGADSLIEIARSVEPDDLRQQFLSPMQLSATYVRNEIVSKPAGRQHSA